jgi:hypothetical protein
MKVTSVAVDPAGASRREKCLVTVCVQLAGTNESMTMNVVVADVTSWPSRSPGSRGQRILRGNSPT